jgi:hypothetical protein
MMTLTAFAVLLGTWLAARHLRHGRGDAVGATRLGIVVFALAMASGLLRIDTFLYLGSQRELSMHLVIWIGTGAAAGLMYLALEPPLRRHFPHLLIGWTRLTRGRWRDPRVGRDILIGVLVAAIIRLLPRGQVLLAQALDVPPNLLFITLPAPGELNIDRFFLSTMLAAPVFGAVFAFIPLLVVFVLTFIVRRAWIAALVMAAAASLANLGQSSTPMIEAPFVMITLLLYLTVLLRVGLLATMTVVTVGALFDVTPLTLQLSEWYAPAGWIVMAIILALAVYGFHASLGGRRVFAGGVLDE